MPSPLFFISYTRTDATFALQLAKDIKNAGINLWIDQLDIAAGARWDLEVEKALKSADGILVILSPQSVSSNNVLDEISYAFDEGKRIIPIHLAACEVPFRIRRLQYVDFSTDYNEGLTHLLQQIPRDDKSIIIETATGEQRLTEAITAAPVIKSAGIAKRYYILTGLLAIILAVAGIFILPRLFRNENAKNTTVATTDSSIKKDTGAGTQDTDTAKIIAGTAAAEKDAPVKNKFPEEKNVKEPAAAIPGITGTDFYKKALVFYNSKNYGAAIINCSAAIDRNYRDAAVYKLRGESYQDNKMPNDAIADYNIALGKNAGDVEVILKRGICYLSTANKELACKDFEKAAAAGDKTAKDFSAKYCLKPAMIDAATIVNKISVKVTRVIVNTILIKGKATYSYMYSLTGEKKYLENIKEIHYKFVDAAGKSFYTTSLDAAGSFAIKRIQSESMKEIYITVYAKDGTISGLQKKQFASPGGPQLLNPVLHQ
ncbi:TIR domain-containing protein [Ferruginibacter profundus]